MLNNRKVTATAISGVVLLSIGTILGLIAMCTYDWVQAPVEIVVQQMPGNGVELYLENPDGICRIGLFEVCCSDTGEGECVGGVYTRPGTPTIQALRICLVVSIILMAVSVVLLLVFMCRDLGFRTAPAQQGISLIMSVATVLYLTVTMSYSMFEYKMEEGLFEHGDGVKYLWGFFLALVGALICPIGVFLICTQWHATEDKEAGVDSDYDGKFAQNTYI